MTEPKSLETPKTTDKLFIAIGQLTVAWALLEAHIDVCVWCIHHVLGGQSIEPDRPQALKRKLSYLRKAFSTISAITSQKALVSRLLTEIATASDDRHDIIHGVVKKFPETAEAEITLSRMIRGQEDFSVKTTTVTPDLIKGHAKTAASLSDRVMPIVRFLLELSRQSVSQDR